jgi:thiol-disulfide isomerase/thioredoxin
MSDERGTDGPTTPVEEAEPARELNPWILRAVAVFGIAVVALVVLRPASGDSSFALPDFALGHLSGDGSISDEDLEGKAVVINFWASWCGPCRRESPLLDRIASDYADRGLVVIGVVVQDTPEDAQAFVRKFGLGYTIADGLDQELYRALRKGASARDGLPQTYFVTTDNNVPLTGATAPVLGELDEPELRAAIESLLGDAR